MQISTELTPAVSVKKLDCYQQPDLLAKAWKQAVAVSYGKIVPQPVEVSARSWRKAVY